MFLSYGYQPNALERMVPVKCGKQGCRSIGHQSPNGLHNKLMTVLSASLSLQIFRAHDLEVDVEVEVEVEVETLTVK